MSPPCIIVAGGSRIDFCRWCGGHRISTFSPLIMHVPDPGGPNVAIRCSAMLLSRSSTLVVDLGASASTLASINQRRRLP